MHEHYERFESPATSRTYEVLRFGYSGRPVIVFPTTLGHFREARDQGLIASIAPLIEAGRAIVYCPDTIYDQSWYNRAIAPGDRVRTHAAYDRMVRHELLPTLQARHHTHEVIVAGCSFGAYTALNFAFKHPDVVSDLVAMSGRYDIRPFLGEHYDDEVYFNNPVDYLADASHPDLWRMGIILGTSEWDICRDASEDMAARLRAKDIPHWLDVRGWREHDWPLWREGLPIYLDRVLG